MPSAFFLVSDEGPATSSGGGPTGAAPPRRHDAHRQPGQLERHRAADVHLSMAALRRGRRQLRRHPGRYAQHLHAQPPRRRLDDPRDRHGLPTTPGPPR
jgi:hypothetical protein